MSAPALIFRLRLLLSKDGCGGSRRLKRLSNSDVQAQLKLRPPKECGFWHPEDQSHNYATFRSLSSLEIRKTKQNKNLRRVLCRGLVCAKGALRKFAIEAQHWRIWGRNQKHWTLQLVHLPLSFSSVLISYLFTLQEEMALHTQSQSSGWTKTA